MNIDLQTCDLVEYCPADHASVSRLMEAIQKATTLVFRPQELPEGTRLQELWETHFGNMNEFDLLYKHRAPTFQEGHPLSIILYGPVLEEVPAHIQAIPTLVVQRYRIAVAHVFKNHIREKESEMTLLQQLLYAWENILEFLRYLLRRRT